MKMKHILITFLTATLLLSGCDQSDDLTGIFTGKTWKLSNVFWDDGSSAPRPVWDSWTESEKEESYDLLMKTKGNFVLNFSGLETDGLIDGSYSGRAAKITIQGTWRADGKKHTFAATREGTIPDGNRLGQEFITGLQSAYKYAGDYNQLRIFFEKDGNRKYMLFRIEDE